MEGTLMNRRNPGKDAGVVENKGVILENKCYTCNKGVILKIKVLYLKLKVLYLKMKVLYSKSRCR